MLDQAPNTASDETNQPVDALQKLQQLQNEQAKAQQVDQSVMTDLVNYFPGGVCAFDNHQRMTVCNDVMKAMSDGLSALLAKGFPTLEDYFRYNADRGEYGPGEVDQHVSARLRLVEHSQGFKYEKTLANGTILEIKGRSLGNTGYVVTSADISKQRRITDLAEVLTHTMNGGMVVFGSDHIMTQSNNFIKERLDSSPVLFGTKMPSYEQYLWLSARNGEYGEGPVSAVVDERMAIIGSGKNHSTEIVARDKKIFEIKIINLSHGGFCELRTDITEERIKAKQIEAVVEKYPDGLAVFDENLELSFHNSTFQSLYEYPDELFIRSPLTMEMITRFDAERGEFGEGDMEKMVSRKMSRARLKTPFEFDQVRPNGTSLSVKAAPIRGGGYLISYIDSSNIKDRQAREFSKSNHCPQTGLPNRALYQDRLNIALAQCERGEKIALLSLQIENYTEIKAACGQETCDKMMESLGSRFSKIKRDTDTFAHLAENQFAIVQVGIDGQEGAEILSRRILRTLNETMDIDGHQFNLDACIGISLPPYDGTFADDVIAKSAAALYRAQCAGPGTIMCHSDVDKKS